MATRNDIETDVTLELNGNITPYELADAVKNFSALLTASHKMLDANVKWFVQVKQGSNLIEFKVQEDYALFPPALDNIANGISHINENGEKPENFDDGMARHLDNISKIANKENIELRMWLNKEPVMMSQQLQKNIKNILNGEFKEYGCVEGRLETLNAHHKKEFYIYESLDEIKIKCEADNDEIFTRAHGLFNKRVQASGMVTYDKKGLPCHILVEEFDLLNPPKSSYKNVQGLLKGYG